VTFTAQMYWDIDFFRMFCVPRAQALDLLVEPF
jgi:hypothetical protein